MSREKWVLEMTAQPIVPPWHSESNVNTHGAELQTAIIKGFTERSNPIWTDKHDEFTFEKEFTFRDHGEFFRGALTMAGIRYTRDFYELLERYEKIKVTIHKLKKVED